VRAIVRKKNKGGEMKVIVDIMIYCKDPAHVYTTLRKEFETDVAIVPGMYLEDRAWPDDEVEITGVTLNPDEPYLMLGLAGQPQEYPDKDTCAKREQQLRGTGWRGANEW
jgi:hypothetical protein